MPRDIFAVVLLLFVVLHRSSVDVLCWLIVMNYIVYHWVQGWHSGEITRLPPMWPGFDSQSRRPMWVEFVGSLLYSTLLYPSTLYSATRGFLRELRFPLDLIVLIVNFSYSVAN